MAEKIFDAQSNYGWGLSLNMTGKAPAVAKRIWNTYADALAYVNDFNDSAIEGLRLTVVADTDSKKNGVYYIEKAGTSKKVDGVDVANNDGILTKVGGADTQTAANYSEAVTLSASLVVGQLIKVSAEQKVGDATYKAGFYIVDAPGTISALATSTGSDDELGALSARVSTLEGNRVTNTEFAGYKATVEGQLGGKADATTVATHTADTVAHVTAEDKAKWNNAEGNAKAYVAEEIGKLDTKFDAKNAAAGALAEAKSYADGKFELAGAAEGAKGYADEVVAAEAELREAGDVSLAGDIATLRSEYEATASRVDIFLDGEGVAQVVDTLSDIKAWMEGDGVNATELAESIAAEKKLREEADASLAADMDEKDASVLEAAKAEAKAQAAQAVADAKAAAAESLKNYYTKAEVDASIAGAKAAAVKDASAYTDAQIAALKIGDYAKTTYVDEQIGAAKTFASTYTDELFNSVAFATDDDITALFS